MCYVPVVFLEGQGAQSGRRVRIDIPDFDDKKHSLLGKKVSVEVSLAKYTTDVSECLKTINGSGLNGFFDKPITAVDPGPKCPVYRVEIPRRGEEKAPDLYWVPKMVCKKARANLKSSPIRRGSRPATNATAA